MIGITAQWVCRVHVFMILYKNPSTVEPLLSGHVQYPAVTLQWVLSLLLYFILYNYPFVCKQ